MLLVTGEDSHLLTHVCGALTRRGLSHRRVAAADAVAERGSLFQAAFDARASYHLGDGYALDAASASLENGVLRVRIPKGAASAPKRVAVHAPEPGEPLSSGDKPGFLERAKRALLGVARRKTN